MFNVVMVAWHLPEAFDAAENNQIIHIWLMHRELLRLRRSAPGCRSRRIRSLPSSDTAVGKIGALVVTNVVMFVLAMALSIFSSSSWYSVYNHVPGVSLSPFADQQIGAGILWICGDFWARFQL